jgi:hypothetical protein
LDFTVLMAQMQFTIEKLQIDGDIMLSFDLGSFDALIEAINAMMNND